MLAAHINGERDPEVLAGLARGTLRSKIPALVDALTGRFDTHHAFMARQHLDQIESHTRPIEALTARIEESWNPFVTPGEPTISGVLLKVAEVIIAEMGA
jgi:transposase